MALQQRTSKNATCFERLTIDESTVTGRKHRISRPINSGLSVRCDRQRCRNDIRCRGRRCVVRVVASITPQTDDAAHVHRLACPGIGRHKPSRSKAIRQVVSQHPVIAQCHDHIGRSVVGLVRCARRNRQRSDADVPCRRHISVERVVPRCRPHHQNTAHAHNLVTANVLVRKVRQGIRDRQRVTGQPVVPKRHRRKRVPIICLGGRAGCDRQRCRTNRQRSRCVREVVVGSTQCPRPSCDRIVPRRCVRRRRYRQRRNSRKHLSALPVHKSAVAHRQYWICCPVEPCRRIRRDHQSRPSHGEELIHVGGRAVICQIPRLGSPHGDGSVARYREQTTAHRGRPRQHAV